ncbi:hypothetical protein ACEWY4_004855 [Coilia grayii]|uniref:Zona pellucida sperm-binding protein 4 n=1 Tax=Coilia grayii TaxID=363190 RepID=A0ABD1KN96_9TELE
MAGWRNRERSGSCSVFGLVLLTCLVFSTWALRVSQTPQRQSAQTPNISQHQSAEISEDFSGLQWPLQQKPLLQWPVQQKPLLQWPLQQKPLLQWPAQQEESLQWPAQQEQKLSDTDVSTQCSVEESDRVPCGEPEVTAAQCKAIDCCFQGGQCYYGKAVTVQCTRDGQFVVVVAKDATVPQLSLDSIALLEGNEGSCGPVDSTESFIIFQFLVSACGTTVMEEEGFVVYENRMSSSYEVAIGPRGSITRDSSYELLFQCRYSGTAVEAVVVDVNPVPSPAPLVVPGPLRVELRLASGHCSTKGCDEDEAAYSSFYTEADYPVTKVIREPVYVEVRVLERTDPHLVLQLGNCWATSSPDPLSEPQWDLLVDGCPYEADWYQTKLLPVTAASGLQYPSHHKRFVMRMFTFVDNDSMLPLKEKVYIHCSTAVCLPTATGSCEQTCSRRRRAAPGLHKEADGSTVSSGEMQVAEAKAPH